MELVLGPVWEPSREKAWGSPNHTSGSRWAKMKVPLAAKMAVTMAARLDVRAVETWVGS